MRLDCEPDLNLETALTGVYGRVVPEQLIRYRSCLSKFRNLYGSGPVQLYHAPGRVNLIGEHTDYNEGFVLPMALDRDILVLVRPRSDTTVRLANVEPETYPARSFELSADIPLRPVGDWANYVQGAAQYMASHYSGVFGFDALVDGHPPFGVPRGAGLSSSSALTVASMAAFVGVNGTPLEGQQLALACSEAEWYVGTRGGIMDHFASVLCRQGHALFLDCRADSDVGHRVRHVPVPDDVAVLVADSGIRHNNTGPHFNRRVAECRVGVQLLCQNGRNVAALRDVSRADWADVEPCLPNEISRKALYDMGIDPDALLAKGVRTETDRFFVNQRCRHVVTENDRVQQAVYALEQGDSCELGALLCLAHASARDDYEISIPEIEALVNAAMRCPGVLGARLTGAGWGGCIVALVQADAAEMASRQMADEYLGETGREADVFVCHSARGAGLVIGTTV